MYNHIGSEQRIWPSKILDMEIDVIVLNDEEEKVDIVNFVCWVTSALNVLNINIHIKSHTPRSITGQLFLQDQASFRMRN